jgi:hypothetical protein
MSKFFQSAKIQKIRYFPKYQFFLTPKISFLNF